MKNSLHCFVLLPACVIAAISIIEARAYAQSRWNDERSAPPFEFHANFSLHETGDLIGQTVRLHRDLNRTLGLPASREPIHLFLFDRRSTYQWYVKRFFPKAPHRRALFIKDGGPGMVFAYRSNEFDVDVRHECTHAVLHAVLPMTPLWLDEGIAEYFEAPPEKRALHHPHHNAMRWMARLGAAPDLRELESIHQVHKMGSSEYRGAWAWVHFMLHGDPEAHDELVHFLADIASHTPPGRLSERLRRRIPNVDELFVEHFKRWKK